MNNNLVWFPGHMKKALEFFKKEKNKINAVLFIVDGRIALTTLKYQFFNFFDKPVYLLVNKKDLLKSSDINFIKKSLSKIWNFKKIFFLSFKENSKLKNFFDKNIFSDFAFFSHFFVCGFPNSGKSTLIKKLTQKKINIGKSPAITKSIQLIKVDERVNLIDAAGILPQKFITIEDYYKFYLVNCIKRSGKYLKEVIEFFFNYLKKYDLKLFNQIFKEHKVSEILIDKTIFSKIDKLKFFLDNDYF